MSFLLAFKRTASDKKKLKQTSTAQKQAYSDFSATLPCNLISAASI